MSKVEFEYGRGGKKVLMARRYAETLQRLGHGTFADVTYQTRMLQAGPTPAEDSLASTEEPLVSDAIAEFAKENGVDLSKVTGTGKDGRIKKSDVEASIAVQV